MMVVSLGRPAMMVAFLAILLGAFAPYQGKSLLATAYPVVQLSQLSLMERLSVWLLAFVILLQGQTLIANVFPVGQLPSMEGFSVCHCLLSLFELRCAWSLLLASSMEREDHLLDLSPCQ